MSFIVVVFLTGGGRPRPGAGPGWEGGAVDRCGDRGE